MPPGDAARIRRYLVGVVEDARLAGETSVELCAGDVRDALDLRHHDAIIDICQVMETRKFRTVARVEFLSRIGPRQGVNTKLRFTLQ